MTQAARQRFTSVSDWHKYLGEMKKQENPEINLYAL